MKWDIYLSKLDKGDIEELVAAYNISNIAKKRKKMGCKELGWKKKMREVTEVRTTDINAVDRICIK